MKRTLTLAILVALVALPALGDVTITNTYTDGQAARITRAMNRVNTATCAYFGLPSSCNTTQARQVFCQRNGIGGVTTCEPDPLSTPENPLPPVCTTTPLVSDCPGATQYIVYGNITLFDKRVLLEKIAEWTAQVAADDAAAAKAAFDLLTQPQKDAVCASLGLPAGCTPFN